MRKYGKLWLDIPVATQAGKLIEKFDLELEDKSKAVYLIPNPVNQVNLAEYPKLKIISTPSTGTNHIDLKECRRRGITVKSLLDDREGLDNIRASSEFALFMILSGLRFGGFRQWQRYERNYGIMLGNELFRKRVGILGYGRIGKNVAKWLTAMGATWESYDYGDSEEALLKIFEDCNIILISMSLNEKSEGLITKDHLSRMQEDAILINVARAEIVNEADLISYAEKGLMYVTDVLHREVAGNVASPLLKLANVIVYPHLAGHTQESTAKAAKIAVELLAGEIEKGKKSVK